MVSKGGLVVPINERIKEEMDLEGFNVYKIKQLKMSVLITI